MTDIREVPGSAAWTKRVLSEIVLHVGGAMLPLLLVTPILLPWASPWLVIDFAATGAALFWFVGAMMWDYRLSRMPFPNRRDMAAIAFLISYIGAFGGRLFG